MFDDTLLLCPESKGPSDFPFALLHSKGKPTVYKRAELMAIQGNIICCLLQLGAKEWFSPEECKKRFHAEDPRFNSTIPRHGWERTSLHTVLWRVTASQSGQC